MLNTLLERHLIKIVGRKQVVGRPFMYATTKEFLIRFGLNDLTDLPKVEDMAEALGFEAPILDRADAVRGDAAARGTRSEEFEDDDEEAWRVDTLTEDTEDRGGHYGLCRPGPRLCVLCLRWCPLCGRGRLEPLDLLFVQVSPMADP